MSKRSKHLLRYVLLAFLSLFFLNGCSKTHYWIYRKTLAGSRIYNSAFLFHPTLNEFNGVGVEFLRGNFGMIGYLNVYAREIPCFDDDPDWAFVRISTSDTRCDFIAYRLEGGQRLFLPTEATEFLIEALCAQESPMVSLEGYCETISCKTFNRYYRKFVKIPIRTRIPLTLEEHPSEDLCEN